MWQAGNLYYNLKSKPKWDNILDSKKINLWPRYSLANACAKNPYAPKIPCHRVIRSDGALGGYSGRGGIKQKLKLLRSEKVAI